MRDTILYKPHTFWLWLRLAAFGFLLVGGVRAAVTISEALRAFPPGMRAVLGVGFTIMFGGVVPIMAGAIALGDYMTMEKQRWRRPTLHSPPLPINPLVINHFFAHCMIVTGASALIATIWGGWIWFALWCFATGGLMLAMLKVTQRLFRERISDDFERDTVHAPEHPPARE